METRFTKLSTNNANDVNSVHWFRVDECQDPGFEPGVYGVRRDRSEWTLLGSGGYPVTAKRNLGRLLRELSEECD